MAPKYKFQEGERVLCFHGPILYEAKCVKIQAKDKVVKYFVHYQGWNKSWDEWVPESRVLKYNEANVQKQKELSEAHNAAKPKGRGSRKRTSTEKDSPATTPRPEKSGKQRSSSINLSTPEPSKEPVKEETGGKKKRVRIDQPSENEPENIKVPDVTITIPDDLKLILKEDCDMINKNNKVIQLPARVTVDEILDEYLNFKKKDSSLTPAKMSVISEITNGIREYFNVVLGTLLLYKSERPQYQQIAKEGDDDALVSSLYGFVHLLRLFVKFGNLLAQSHIDEKSIQSLIPHFDDFISFCLTNASSYHNEGDYITDSSDHTKKAT